MHKYFFFVLPLFLLAVFLFGLTPVHAQYGLDVTAGRTSYNKTDTPESVVTTIVNAALVLVYIIFLILVVYAGIRWMTAQGNEEHVTKAKNILEAAIIGVAVISMAYALTNFVLGKVGANKPTESGANPPTTCDQESCPTGQSCDVATGQCVVEVIPPTTCDQESCPTGQSCDIDTGLCVVDVVPPPVDKCAGVACTLPQTCDPDTGSCIGAPPVTTCPTVPCGINQTCNAGVCEAIPAPTCVTTGCTGTDVCDTVTGVCKAKSLTQNKETVSITNPVTMNKVLACCNVGVVQCLKEADKLVVSESEEASRQAQNVCSINFSCVEGAACP